MTSSEDVSKPGGMEKISIRKIRNVILVVLTVSVLGFTAGVFLLVQRIFDNFGPKVREDLIWKTVRGAQELAKASDLGFAMADGDTVLKAFGDYRQSHDVLAIVALDAKGTQVAVHGSPPESNEALFAGPAAKLRETPEYLVSWAGSFIESAEVGKVAVVVTTKRLEESRALLRQILLATGIAGILAWAGGLLFVNFFTKAIGKRDAQLAGYAATLEQKVAERTAELGRRNLGMRLVLDNVSQGFVTVNRSGVMEPERSAIVDKWLGHPKEGQTFQEYIRPVDPHAEGWFGMTLQSIEEDVMPLEVNLDQLPKRLSVGKRTMKMDYIPILEGEKLQKLLIVMSDVTAELARERMEQEQREMAHLFQAVSNDRGGFEEFFAEANQLAEQIHKDKGLGPLVEKRLVHTLKGSSALFHLSSVAEACHGIENRMAEDGTGLTDIDRQAIKRAWDRVAQHARQLLGEGSRQILELPQEDFQQMRTLVDRGVSHKQLARVLSAWHLEPVSVRLSRLGKQAQHLATRIGKPAVQVVVDGGGVRLEAGRYSAFFTTLTHVIRNAVDHGIEEPEVRRQRGKPEAGKLTFSSRVEGGQVVIRMADDGAGVDWTKIAAKAKAAGLPHQTQEQLVEALFSDGVSTKEEITIVSGRGVGMSAVKSALTLLGGTVRIRSEKGEGTTFEFSFPSPDAFSYEQASAAA